MAHCSIRTKLLIAFVIVMALTMVSDALAFVSVIRAEQLSRTIYVQGVATEPGLQTINGIANLVGGFGWFVPTGSDAYLQRYFRGAAELAQLETVPLGPEEKRQWDDVRQRVSEWRSAMADPAIAVRARQAGPVSVDSVLNQVGNEELYGASLGLVDDALNVERQLLVDRDRSLQAAARWAELSLGIGGAAALAAALAMVVLLDRDIGWPIKRLALTARRGASGDSVVTFRLPRSDEIGEAAAALDEMVAAVRRTDEQAVEQLRERAVTAETSVEQSRQIAEAFPEAILIADATGQIVVSNAAANRLVGRSLLGLSLAEAPRFVTNLESQPLLRALSGEITAGLETALRSDSGSLVPVLLNATPLFQDGGVTGALGVFQDVTALNREKEEFLAAIMRDLRPWFELARFRVTQLNNQLRSKSDLESAWLTKRLDETQVGLQQIGELIDRLLDYIRLRGGTGSILQRRHIDLVALTESCVAEIGPIAVGFRIEVRADFPSLVGNWDAGQLRRVITRLLRNVINYSLKGGGITVHIGREDDSAGQRWALLSVFSNQGVGIGEDEMERALGRNSTDLDASRARDAGLGIRLTVARRIVEQHGGTLTVETREGFGAGASFNVRLPLEPMETPAPAE